MIHRQAADILNKLASQFRTVAVVGPRQSGKTTLIREVFPQKPYISLEGMDERKLALDDPRQFLSRFPNGAILDEVQRAPDLFSYLQQMLDETDQRGLFILSGSNNFSMLESITQSLAGRIGYLDLLTFSLSENNQIKDHPTTLNDHLFLGGYPAVTFQKMEPHHWLSAYVRTYIERDVRQIKNISSLELFQRTLYLCAGRIGQQLNLSNLAAEVGTDHKTIQSWLGIMQASYILYFLQPYYKNFNKRIIKAPKIYFYDTGLASFLLGINQASQLTNHMSKGFLFENWIISELLKNRFNKAQRSNLFYFRDSTGNEIDVLLDHGSTQTPIEIKSAETLNDSFFKNLSYFEKLTGQKGGILMYAGDKAGFEYMNYQVRNWKDVHTI